MAESRKIVVIGAGVGGLCAAIRLASAGCAVTLVERQAGPGGKMRTVPSVGGPVDAGPTVLTLRHVFDDLFAAAGERLEDHITFVPQPILARHWWPGGGTLDLFTDREASAAAILNFAGPRAEAEFVRFDRLSRTLYDAFEAPMMQSAHPDRAGIAWNALRSPRLWPTLLGGRTLGAQMARSFTDPRLRQLFGRYATYVGGIPHLSPAVLGLIWQAESRGVWAVRGGMGRLAAALADLAGRVGVTLRYGVTAGRVVCHGGRVARIDLSGGDALACDAAVFGGDPGALLQGDLGAGATAAVRPVAARPRSLSACVWSFAATPAAFPLTHHNVFFCADPETEFRPLAMGRMPRDATLYLCAQDRGDGTPTGPERFEIVMNAPPNPTPPTAEETDACRTMTFPTLARFGLTFDQAPPDAGLMTPHGFATLFPGSEGAIYGRSPHGSLASFRRPLARTRLPGLYLAGGGAHPGAGVPMAALSGKHAAEAIWGDLISRSRSHRTATPGGTSTVSPTTEPAP